MENLNRRGEPPVDFLPILEDESDGEGDGDSVGGDEIDESLEQYEEMYVKWEFINEEEEDADENAASSCRTGQPTMNLLAMYDEHGEELLRLPSSSGSTSTTAIRLRDNSHPASTVIPKSSPASAAQNSPPSEMPRSHMCDVVIRVGEIEAEEESNDVTMELEDGAFHLADEHCLYRVQGSLAEAQPLQGGRQRARARGRGGRMMDGARWVIGDRLQEVNVNDDDVPEELREMIRRVVNRREVARVTALERGRRLRARVEDMDDDDDETANMPLVGEGSSAHFVWSPMETYQGEREAFLPERTPGPTVPSTTAYDAFRQYWDDDILSHIVTETNRYARQIAGTSVPFAKNWYETNIHEILLLFSFWMMLGIIRMPSINSCFSNNPLLQTNIFRKLFTSHRYANLCRALHFNNNDDRPTDNSNRLFCIEPILTHLNSRFMSTYTPSQNICIDESLTLWKGILSFRQYIKTKASRFGMKTLELCESSTGYLWSFFIYIGGHTQYDPMCPPQLQKSTATVLTLIRPLLDKGYTLFIDNWFNSPLLARYLKGRKTDCVGTLRTTRSNVPPLIPMTELKEGEFVARHSGDVTVLAYRDKKKIVTTLSTYHGVAQDLMPPRPHRPAQYKPQVILDYNRNMGGVDRKDQMLEPYLLERKKCAKWNRKIFKRLLNCSINNARILLQSSSSTTKQHIVFRLELVDQLIRFHLDRVAKRPSAQLISSSISTLSTPNHFPVPNTHRTSNGRISRRHCVFCKQQNLKFTTMYVCSACEVPLCIHRGCFRQYHIK